MKKRFVFSTKLLPTRMPTIPTVVALLALEHWYAAGWVWGVMGSLLAILWLNYFYALWAEESVDPLDMMDAPEEKEAKQPSKWEQRIAELQKKQREQRTS